MSGRRAFSVLLTAGLLLVAAPAAVAVAVAQPKEVVRGTSYDWITTGTWHVPETCRVYLGELPAGSCRTREPGKVAPLVVSLTVPLDAPLGTATVWCDGCLLPSAFRQPSTGAELATVEVVAPVMSPTTPLSSSSSPSLSSSSLSSSSPSVPRSSSSRPQPSSPSSSALVSVSVSPTSPSGEAVTTTADGTPGPSTSDPAPPPAVGMPPSASTAFSGRDWLLPALLAATIGIFVLALLQARGPPLSGPPGARPVRVWLAPDRPGPRRPWPADQPLRPGRAYVLWLDIGALHTSGRGRTPLRAAVFDQSGALRDPPTRDLLVDRQPVPPQAFRFTAPDTGTLRLRCNLYHRGALLQSFLVVADGRGWSAVRDYVRSFSLDPAVVATGRPHALSIVVNHDSPDQHGLYVHFGGTGASVATRIAERTVARFQEGARAIYRSMNDAGWDRQLLPALLGEAAVHGRDVYVRFQTDVDLALARTRQPRAPWRELRATAAHVQVVHPDSSDEWLPAAMIYDFPLDRLDPHEYRLCEAYFADLDGTDPPRCARGGCATGSPDVVCPAGFWGFRFAIGNPMTFDPRVPVPDHPAAPVEPPVVVLGRADDPQFVAQRSHLRGLRHVLPHVQVIESNRREAFLQHLRTVAPSVIYLYCHGGVNDRGLGYVEIGDGEWLTAAEFDDDFGGRWQSMPLVLLNGCSTVAPGADHAFPLTPRLLWAGAAGVVGTEVDVREGLACRFADTLLPALLGDGHTVGQAMTAARRAVLRDGSALGLAYTALAPADLNLVPSRERVRGRP
ncbi:CHAT domain-containing protein [Actinosynnema sp. NPDC023794]